MPDPTGAIAKAAVPDEDAPEATDDIQFIEYHLPALPDGTYHIKVEQTVDIIRKGDASPSNSVEPKPPDLRGAKDVFFSVVGPRFGLDSQEIRAVFPPEGSTGDHENVLPHIVLNRSTLPWELQSLHIDPDDTEAKKEASRTPPWLEIKSKTPWLALLLFNESDPPPVPRTLPLSKLMAEEQFAGLPAQITGDHDDTPVTVIDVPQDLLRAILPRVQLSDETKEINELRLLAHVRQTYAEAYLFSTKLDLVDELDAERLPTALVDQFKKEGYVLSAPSVNIDQPQNEWTVIDGNTQYKIHKEENTLNVYTEVVDGEVAIIIGNRLPRARSQSTVHLVSLEHRYRAAGFSYPADQHKNVTLVSLKSWRFACDEPKGSFKGLLMNLDCNPSTLRPPDPTPGADADASSAKAARRFVEMGYTPLPHYLRTGDKTVSWYHGPLAPAIHDNDHPDLQNQLPARTADALARYLPEYGMLDVSYAAAWELGRLLTLQSKQVATTLYQWKRTHAAAIKNARNHLDHLPFAKLEGEAELPDVVQQWFIDLALLRGAPFDYLVPDARMLPVESIRFFRVDPHWVECLLDGAFSIGRVSEADRQRDHSAKTQASEEADSQLSGFLLRSAVVSGWPDLQVDSYSADINDLDAVQSPDLQLPLVRMERLSPNVLLCLFAGEVQTVDIHLKPETLHFGVSLGDDRHTFDRYPGGCYKELRSRSGGQDVAAVTPPNWDKAFVDAVAAELDKGKPTAKIRGLLPNGDKVLKFLGIECDEPGSEWRIYAEQTVKQIPMHWTYYVQRVGDVLTVHDTLAINVPNRAGEPLTDSSDPIKRRVLAIHELQQELQNGLTLFPDKENNLFTAAEFALEMVEGVQKVRFTITDGIAIRG
jgi:hypothetical protein